MNKCDYMQHLSIVPMTKYFSLWSFTKVTESLIFKTAVETEHMACCHTLWSHLGE